MWRGSTVPCFLSLNLLQTMLDLFWIRREHSAGGHSISTFPCKHRGYLSSISGACGPSAGATNPTCGALGRQAILLYVLCVLKKNVLCMSCVCTGPARKRGYEFLCAFILLSRVFKKSFVRSFAQRGFGH